MEKADKHSDKSIDEPNAKRPKIESECSTSSKPEAVDPFLSLPRDIIAKIIGFIPIAQWPSLESLDHNFQLATYIAWRQLRNINVERELMIKFGNDRTSNGKYVASILQKLVERSAFLSSLSVFGDRTVDAEFNSVAVHALAQFEHLQSITVGNTKLFPTIAEEYKYDELRRNGHGQEGILLERVVEFLESTRSRLTLKELKLFDVVQRQDYRPTIVDRFASSFVSGQEFQLPLKLEKFSFSSSDKSLHIRLDTLDTSRLVDVRLSKAMIDPEQLTNLITRTSNLFRIELSIKPCHRHCAIGHLQANMDVLAALACHEMLTAIKIDLGFYWYSECSNFGHEFVEMLKRMGRRGKLRQLALGKFVFYPPFINSNEICTTIRDYLPSLRSIELDAARASDESVFNIAHLPDLEEVNFTNVYTAPRMANAIKKLTQLPNLKRLACIALTEDDTNSLEYLSNATTLMDLRCGNARWISTSIYDKWSDGFGSNLETLMLREFVENYHHDEVGLVRLLKKAVRLRVLILHGYVTDRSLVAVAESCPQLEIFGAHSVWNEITIPRLQAIVDRCPKLKRLGGIGDEMRMGLRFSKYRKIGHVDMEFMKYDFDDDEYD